MFVLICKEVRELFRKKVLLLLRGSDYVIIFFIYFKSFVGNFVFGEVYVDEVGDFFVVSFDVILFMY